MWLLLKLHCLLLRKYFFLYFLHIIIPVSYLYFVMFSRLSESTFLFSLQCYYSHHFFLLSFLFVVFDCVHFVAPFLLFFIVLNYIYILASTLLFFSFPSYCVILGLWRFSRIAFFLVRLFFVFMLLEFVHLYFFVMEDFSSSLNSGCDIFELHHFYYSSLTSLTYLLIHCIVHNARCHFLYFGFVNLFFSLILSHWFH